jgi:hypothetical protein
MVILSIGLVIALSGSRESIAKDQNHYSNGTVCSLRKESRAFFL